VCSSNEIYKLCVCARKEEEGNAVVMDVSIMLHFKKPKSGSEELVVRGSNALQRGNISFYQEFDV